MFQLNSQPQPNRVGLLVATLTAWFHRRHQQRMLQGAVARAYQRFARHNPQYADSLFDMYFLTHTAWPLVQRYLLATNSPTPAEFATAWCGQFPSVAPSQQQVAEATRMAAAFLRHLDAQLYA